MTSLSLPPEILAYAVRYALGRQSYAVTDVVDALRASARELSVDTKRMIVRDIEEYQQAVADGNRSHQPDDIVGQWADAVDALMQR